MLFQDYQRTHRSCRKINYCILDITRASFRTHISVYDSEMDTNLNEGNDAIQIIMKYRLGLWYRKSENFSLPLTDNSHFSLLWCCLILWLICWWQSTFTLHHRSRLSSLNLKAPRYPYTCLWYFKVFQTPASSNHIINYFSYFTELCYFIWSTVGH